MDADKKYVTQITRNDLKELADAANIHAGEGIEVERTDDGLKVSVDRQVLSLWVRTLIQGGRI